MDYSPRATGCQEFSGHPGGPWGGGCGLLLVVCISCLVLVECV